MPDEDAGNPSIREKKRTGDRDRRLPGAAEARPADRDDERRDAVPIGHEATGATEHDRRGQGTNGSRQYRWGLGIAEGNRVEPGAHGIDEDHATGLPRDNGKDRAAFGIARTAVAPRSPVQSAPV